MNNSVSPVKPQVVETTFSTENLCSKIQKGTKLNMLDFLNNK